MPVLNERLVGHPWQGTQRTRTDIPCAKGCALRECFYRPQHGVDATTLTRLTRRCIKKRDPPQNAR